MSVSVKQADPSEPDAAALLRQSHALMESLFPPEDNFYLDIDALKAPHISFFIAEQNDQTLGTAALANKGDYGEIKSMFVSPKARGLGVGAQLLATLEETARALGLPVLKLETGDKLEAAHRLYARAGFTRCDPFGDYAKAGSSLFMEKPL